MAALETTHLYLLSAIMQSLAALWGIVFVVYVFIYEYYSRTGGWQQMSENAIDRIRDDIKAAPNEIKGFPAARTYPSVTRRLHDGIDSVPFARQAVVRNRRVFRQVLFTGPIVLTSLLIDVAVLVTNDAGLMGPAVAFFLVALFSLAFVLLHEVWTSISGGSKLIKTLDQVKKDAEKAYEEARETIPEEG